MKRFFRIFAGAALAGVSALFCFPAAAAGQTPSGQTPASRPAAAAQVTFVQQQPADSVPQTTVVPVQQPAVQVADYTTLCEVPAEGVSRAERRELRAKNYAAGLDSLVQSRNYLFWPATMQEMPDGAVRSIYADYFFFGMFADHVEVHLPVDRAGSQYIERLNFDSMSVSNYQFARVQCGWMISCNIADRDTNYHASFTVCTATGETTLTLITPSVTMRYTGRIGDRSRQPRR